MGQTESGRVDLKFTKDSRILAGVSGAVSHMADVAGMEESRRAELVAALEDALHAAFDGKFHDDSPVDMTIAPPAGHLEVVFTFHGDSADGKRAKEIQSVLRDRLDKVTLDVAAGKSRITLVKEASARTKKR